MSSFVLALCGTLFAFLMTALGSALVFFIRGKISARMERLCMGFAGGVMSAAAVFSLLIPAVEQLEESGACAWPVVAGGFTLGALVIALLDALLHRLRRTKEETARRRALMVSAVTLHNIPEGMAVGLAFALAAQGNEAALAAAMVLALGIGIQNIPEGAAISLPLHQGGMGRMRSFLIGAASGAVEPLFGAGVVFFAAALRPALPMMMAFAAGAMMLVTIAEMFPAAAAKRDGAMMAVGGYVLMMALDLAL